MTEPQWHCYYDRTQDGPLAESALIRRFGERLVPLHALVWSETWRGDEWRPAREIDAFRRAATGPLLAPPVPVPIVPAVAGPIPRAASPSRPPPLPVRARAVNAPFLPPGVPVQTLPRRGGIAAPLLPPPVRAPRAAVSATVVLPPPGVWERFWARMIDLTVGGNLLLALLVLPLVPDLPRGGLLAQCVLGPLCWMLVETFLINTFGTTPGKWVFDIQVQTPGGNLPTFWQAARRCAAVFALGLGAGIIVPFGLVGTVVAYNQLLLEGQTSWDKAAGLTVVRRGSGWLGWSLLSVALCAGVWFLIETWRP